jgi:transglutaminase-like putative cysteine protease
MMYQITHRTVYEYDAPVTVSHHAARLQPRADHGQTCLEFSLVISPEPTLRTSRIDYFGNAVCNFSIEEIHSRLEVAATSAVHVSGATAPALGLSPSWEEVAQLFREVAPTEFLEAYQFIFDSPNIQCSPELAAFAMSSFTPGQPLLSGVRDLNRRIHTDFRYDNEATTVATPLETVFRNRVGVCQDFAHVAIACLRSIGLPARYVSGYLRTRPPEGEPPRVGADASHAWFSIFSPGFGWVDFDPTNDLMPDTEHVAVAYGRDFGDVSPVSGMIVGGGDHKVIVGVDVNPF